MRILRNNHRNQSDFYGEINNKNSETVGNDQGTEEFDMDAAIKRFNQLLKSNYMNEVVEIWKPWWCSPVETSLVSLPNVSFNPLIKYSIVDLLYSYVAMARTMNGLYSDNLTESLKIIMSCSPTLASQKIYNSFAEMLYSLSLAFQKSFVNFLPCSYKVFHDDVIHIVNNELAVNVLEDLNKMFIKCVEQKIAKRSSNLFHKKLIFFMSVLNQLDLQEISVDLNLDSVLFVGKETSNCELTKSLESNKLLIKELD
jgi:hypothetical protein